MRGEERRKRERKYQLNLTSENLRTQDNEISPKFRTQIDDGYDFIASVRDGASRQCAFRAKMTNLVLVLVVAAKAH